MWQIYTQHAKRVVFLAQEEAFRLGTTDVNVEHLLLGLLRRRDCGAARVLDRLGATRRTIRGEIDRSLPRHDGLLLYPDMQLTPDAKRAIDLAHEEARGLGSETIGTVHLLLGFIGGGESPAARLFAEHGVTPERVREAIRGLQEEGPALDTEEAFTTWSWILPDPGGAHLLLLRMDEGWSLPTIEEKEEWFPEGAGGVARRVGRRLGLSVTALRHLHEGDEGESQIGELENHTPEWTPPQDARWVSEREVETLPLVDTSHRDIMRAWFAEGKSGTVSPLRPPWERRGWLAAASEWVRGQMEQAGVCATGPIEQLKTAWSGSCLLRVATDAGDLYFKAVGAQPPSEPVLLAELAACWPRDLPTILAIDAERGWMLTRDFSSRYPEQGSPEEAGALRRFAQIQLEAGASVPRWLELGCPDRRPERMPEYQEALLADTGALRPGDFASLKEAEIRRLRELSSRFREMWGQLGAYTVPPSIVQQDFCEGHIVLTEVGTLYFDWSDTVVSHPFFSATRFLEQVQISEEPAHERGRWLRDAYMEPWTTCESRERLLEAFEIARALNPLYQAIRWYLALPYLEPGVPWRLHLARAVPQQLRAALHRAAP